MDKLVVRGKGRQLNRIDRYVGARLIAYLGRSCEQDELQKADVKIEEGIQARRGVLTSCRR